MGQRWAFDPFSNLFGQSVHFQATGKDDPLRENIIKAFQYFLMVLISDR
jgi:hypothetical protein